MVRQLMLGALCVPAIVWVFQTSPGQTAEDGFVPLFNGKDLTGWVNVNCHPSTFFVKDGEIITTGRPTGFLRTEKQYENFILEMEWMHENKEKMGNSGLFVWGDPLPAVGTPYTRGIEVQILVNFETDWATSHGDIFSIWGADCTPDRPHPKGYKRCLPSENRCKGGGEWNHYRVVANDGVIKLHVNGKEVSGVSQCKPRKGYLALESEGAVCHFRNIRLKELPSTHPKPDEIADLASGHRLIFNGLDLDGWKTSANTWTASNGRLIAKGKEPISTTNAFGPGELLFDWKPGKGSAATVTVAGKTHTLQVPASVPSHPVHVKGWYRTRLPIEERGPVTITPSDGLELMHVFVREN